jgi:4-amino-4-deoxy-L-arabinose transferase-like glycosyltransferase
VWIAAAVFVAVELAVSARYGFHRDELYFVVAGRHLAAGYVDQPPLAPLLTRVATALFGTSPSAVRVFPALAGGAVVVMTGAIARVLGARGPAQTLAAVAMGCAPVTLAAAHLANTTVYDLLAWSAAIYYTLLAVRHGRSKAWLGAGVAIGLGLENKDLLLLLVVAVGVGLIASGRGAVLRDRWLWAGVAVAVLLWLPNLVWQGSHAWPEVTMSRALRKEHSSGSDYTTVLPAQLLYLGLAAVPLAVAGARHLLRDRSLRFVAVAAVLVLAFVVVDIPGRPYYTDGMLALVFAAGAVAVQEHARTDGAVRRWLAAPIAGAVVGAVLVLPILPEAALSHIGGIHKLNYDLTETVGWPQLTEQVASVYRALPPAARREASVFTSNYGEASALVLYGGRYGLPHVLSGHNTFWLWGPGSAPDGTVIAVGAAGDLRPFFGSCTTVAAFRPPHNVVNDENGVGIATCRVPTASWRAFWGRLQQYG